MEHKRTVIYDSKRRPQGLEIDEYPDHVVLRAFLSHELVTVE